MTAYKIGDVGPYGGIITKIRDIPLDVRFHVSNGYWDGIIVEVDGTRYIEVEQTGKIFDITDRLDSTLEI